MILEKVPMKLSVVEVFNKTISLVAVKWGIMDHIQGPKQFGVYKTITFVEA